jgi:hypothetical protein
MHKVFVLTEDGDIVAVFELKELALKCAKENDIKNFHIQEFTVRVLKFGEKL